MKPIPAGQSEENGHRADDAAILSRGALHLVPARQEALVGDRIVRLNFDECRILRLLIEQQPHVVVTRTDMMMATWGYAPPDRAALIDEIVAELQEKLGQDVPIRTFPGIGYSLE